MRPPPASTLFPYTTLFRSVPARRRVGRLRAGAAYVFEGDGGYRRDQPGGSSSEGQAVRPLVDAGRAEPPRHVRRSEEHTSELQSHHDLVCRLLLEKKKLCPPATFQTAVPLALRANHPSHGRSRL